MERVLIGGKARSRRSEDRLFDGLDIEIADRPGLLRVRDPRLFRAGRRGFCERLIEVIAGQAEIKRAEVDLATAACQVEFSSGSNAPRFMADAFVASIRGAIEGRHRGRCWRRLGRWSSLTAFRKVEAVSLWEVLDVRPGRIGLRYRGLGDDRAKLCRLADTLAELDGIDSCRLARWSRRIILSYPPDAPIGDRIIDRVELAWEGLKVDEPRLGDRTRSGLRLNSPARVSLSPP